MYDVKTKNPTSFSASASSSHPLISNQSADQDVTSNNYDWMLPPDNSQSASAQPSELPSKTSSCNNSKISQDVYPTSLPSLDPSTEDVPLPHVVTSPKLPPLLENPLSQNEPNPVNNRIQTNSTKENHKRGQRLRNRWVCDLDRDVESDPELDCVPQHIQNTTDKEGIPIIYSLRKYDFPESGTSLHFYQYLQCLQRQPPNS